MMGPLTKMMHAIVQITRDVGYIDGGWVEMIVPNRLTRTSIRVISKAILAGMTSGGMVKLIHEIATIMRLGK